MASNPKPTTRIPVATVTSRKHLKPEIIAEVNGVLETYYARSVQKAGELHPRFGELLETMRALTLAGGKRSRPYIAVLAYEAYGGNQFKDICRVGAGIELLHSAMLIHDDIIDRDYIRYGVDNIAGQYRRRYGALTRNNQDANHYADSTAIMAGDIAITAAYQLVLESGFTPEQKIAALEMLSEAAFRVAGGELIDTDSSMYPFADTDPLTVAEIKTAHYSFVTPLLIGAVLADADKDELAKLDELGKHIGTAFQLCDDLLGIFGDETRTGKSAVSDIREGRQTYLLHTAYAAADTGQGQVLRQYYGKTDITPGQASLVRAALASSGARAATEQKIAAHAAKANEIVKTLTIDAASRQIFSKFITSMTERDK